MKVQVDLEVAGRAIHEVIDVKDATDLLVKAKDRVAAELGWKGMIVKTMTPIGFAQTAVKLYNENYKATYPLPQTPEEFLTFGEQTGRLKILER